MLVLWFTLLQTVAASYFYLNTTLQIEFPGKITSTQLSYSNMLIIVSIKQPSSVNSSLLLYYLNQTTGFSDYKYQLASGLEDISGDINFMALSRQANILMLGIQNKTIRFYSIHVNAQIKYAFEIEGWQLGENHADLSLDTYFVALAFKNYTIVVLEKNISNILNQRQSASLRYDKLDTIFSNNVSISCLKISPNSSKLYVGYENSTICIYDLVNVVYHFNTKLIQKDDITSVIHLSDLGKVMVTGSKRGVIRMYISDSKGHGLYLSQTINQSFSEIVKIKVATTNLLMIVTNKKGETFQYERIEETFNWIYNKDQSKRFEDSGETSDSNKIVFPTVNLSDVKVLAPILSADDTIVLNPSYSRASLEIMVSCSTTHTQCDQCSNNNVCSSCNQYYYLTGNNCSRCPNGCMLCRDANICFRCASSNYIDLLRGICIPCNRNFPNCRECDGIKRCTKCVEAYELVENACELVQELDPSPNIVIRRNSTNSTLNQVNEKIVDESSAALPIFIIVCLVFFVLLVLASIFLFYVIRIFKKQQIRVQQTNHQSLPTEERISNI